MVLGSKATQLVKTIQKCDRKDSIASGQSYFQQDTKIIILPGISRESEFSSKIEVFVLKIKCTGI